MAALPSVVLARSSTKRILLPSLEDLDADVPPQKLSQRIPARPGNGGLFVQCFLTPTKTQTYNPPLPLPNRFHVRPEKHVLDITPPNILAEVAPQLCIASYDLDGNAEEDQECSSSCGGTTKLRDGGRFKLPPRPRKRQDENREKYLHLDLKKTRVF